jgi:hypothetical protein
MLPVSLDSLLLTFPSVCESKRTTQQTEGKVNNRESRDTGNIGHKTERRQKKQKHNTEN